MANLVVSAVSTFDNKGLKKGQKEISAFEKNLKSLGKTFGVAFGAAAIVSYGKKSVDAFMKDEAAAKSLEQQLKNTGYAFSSPDVEYYIANLQKMYGVLDDQLRPAFQTLLTASGSLTKSQKALALALDISAGTGKSVEEVSMALAKGFSGQTTALSRLGAGLDKATLASGDMNKIMDELQSKFSGQATARLDTYAGKMDQLKIASANASEAIGKGILNALSAIGKDKNIASVTSGMENLALAIGNVITGLGVMIGKLTSIAQNSGLLNLINKLIQFNFKYSGLGLLASIGAQSNAPSSNFTYSLGSGAASEIAKQQEVKVRKALITQLQKEAELKKLQNKYDMERIQLTAALMQATDEETKKRLAEKLALLDGDASMIDDYLELSNSIQTITESTTVATAAFDSLAIATKNLILSFGVSPSQVGTGGTLTGSAASFNSLPISYGLSTNVQDMSGTSQAVKDLYTGFGQTVVVNVDATNMIDPANMTKVVQESILSINKSGLPTVPAGQGFGF
jgi:hypothetical protein